MSSKYDLTELAGQDYFSIKLDGYVYRMRYPSSTEMLELANLGEDATKDNLRLEEVTVLLTTEADTKVREALLKEAETLKGKLLGSQNSILDWAMQYISAEDDAAPDFRATIMGKSVKYLLSFINIIQQELKSG